MTDHPRLTFQDLVAPLEPGRFFAEHWTRKGVLCRQDGRTFEAQFNWQAINAILNAGDIAFPKIKVSHRDKPVPAEQFTGAAGGQRLVEGRAVLALFDEGASFGITGADSHWPPLRSVVDCLYDTFLESVHTNVYCSPAHTQGFQCHFDLHEVFVLQVAGEKHWRVYAPTADAPVTSWRAEDSPHETATPYIDAVLRPGDVLYVPRGHWHYAVAKDSTSLHVTVGITCRKGTEFLDWLGSELLAADAVWRRNLPLLADTARRGEFVLPDDWRAWTAEVRRSLTAKLDEPELFDRFCRETLAAVVPIQNVTLMDGSAAMERLRFQRPAGRRHYFTNGTGDLTVVTGDAEIQFDDADADLVRQLFDAEAFTLDDVRTWKPGVDIAEIGELLTSLIKGGFLIAVERETTGGLP